MTVVSTVPTARMRTGDFSQLSAVIYDPTAGRTPFAGNVIPAGRIDAIAQKFLNLLSAADVGRAGEQLHGDA